LSYSERLPDDINFGTASTNLYFTFPSPKMPKPVFAPRWMVQGNCPYIAYATDDEDDALLFSMRIQLVRERRGPGEPAATSPPTGTVQMRCPIIERICSEYGIPNSVWFDLELLWPNIRFALPESGTDWVKNLLPEDWPVAEDQEYEYPSEGAYSNNDDDHVYTNLYRT
jgi:hypothetical protein